MSKTEFTFEGGNENFPYPIPEEAFTLMELPTFNGDKRIAIHAGIYLPIEGQKELKECHIGIIKRITRQMKLVVTNMDKFEDILIRQGKIWMKRKLYFSLEKGVFTIGKNSKTEYKIDISRLDEVVCKKLDEVRLSDRITIEEAQPVDLTGYFDKYASELTKKVLTEEILNTVHEYKRSEDGIVKSALVRYFGVMLEYPSSESAPIKRGTEKLMEIVNWGVSESYLEFGVMDKLHAFNLHTIVDKDKPISVGPDQNITQCTIIPTGGENLLYAEPYTKRTMIAIYIPCHLTDKEFNAKAKEHFGIEYDVAFIEGQEPTWKL